MFEKIRGLVDIIRETLGAFFAIDQKDDVIVGTKKISGTVLRRVIYSILDYWLAGLSAALVIAMKALGHEFLAIFFAMWAFDIIVACAFVVIWYRTGNDLTLGEDYRRAADVIHSKSCFWGWLFFLGVIVKASFWDGPEHIVIFFRKEIKTETRMAIALLLLTALQAVLWAAIYSLGYDSVAELIQYLKGGRIGM